MEETFLTFESGDFVQFLNPIRGLTKRYITNCVLNRTIQEMWSPQVGDIIVGITGNIFVIGGMHQGSESIGGNTYYFGSAPCSRDGDGFMESNNSFEMNRSGKKYTFTEAGKFDFVNDSNTSKISDFRWVPYPHELSYELQRAMMDDGSKTVEDYLDDMIKYEPKLYEQILDSNIANSFNCICNLARGRNANGTNKSQWKV